MDAMKVNLFSHLTAKERDRLSFPARYLLQQGLLVGRILDFGCGLGSDVAFLQAEGLDIIGYDPHYFPNIPLGKFDTIICLYVLNVLFPEEQSAVLMDVSTLLNSSGIAYFAVRRDIKVEGFRTHKIHRQPTYQCNVNLPFKSILKNENCEIFSYQDYTLLNLGKASVSPFFHGESQRQLIVESALVFAIYDAFPVSSGHSLIIPKRLIANYFELSWREQAACWMVLNRVKKILDSEHQPAGYNVGINIAESAGQTVDHVHIHLIPRYAGDVAEPRGGIRGVIPSKKDY